MFRGNTDVVSFLCEFWKCARKDVESNTDRTYKQTSGIIRGMLPAADSKIWGVRGTCFQRLSLCSGPRSESLPPTEPASETRALPAPFLQPPRREVGRATQENSEEHYVSLSRLPPKQ